MEVGCKPTVGWRRKKEKKKSLCTSESGSCRFSKPLPTVFSTLHRERKCCGGQKKTPRELASVFVLATCQRAECSKYITQTESCKIQVCFIYLHVLVTSCDNLTFQKKKNGKKKIHNDWSILLVRLSAGIVHTTGPRVRSPINPLVTRFWLYYTRIKLWISLWSVPYMKRVQHDSSFPAPVSQQKHAMHCGIVYVFCVKGCQMIFFFSDLPLRRLHRWLNLLINY